jgi:hypothetical protein
LLVILQKNTLKPLTFGFLKVLRTVLLNFE